MHHCLLGDIRRQGEAAARCQFQPMPCNASGLCENGCFPRARRTYRGAAGLDPAQKRPRTQRGAERKHGPSTAALALGDARLDDQRSQLDRAINVRIPPPPPPHSIRKSRYRLLPATAPSEKQMPGAKAVQEQVRRRINLKFSSNALIKTCFTSLATEFERRLVRV